MAELDWELSSGLPDKLTVIVKNAYFGYLQEYQGGAVPLLIWDVVSPDEPDVNQVSFPIGTGWTPVQGGKRVEHESGHPKMNKNSVFGRMITKLRDELKAHALMQELYQSSPWDAPVWIGHSFVLERIELEYKGLQSDKPIVRLMPTQYLGKQAAGAQLPASGGPGLPTGQSSSPTVAQPPQSVPTPPPAPAVDPMRAQLVELAKAHTDFNTFVAAGCALPGVMGNAQYLGWISNPAEVWKEAGH